MGECMDNIQLFDFYSFIYFFLVYAITNITAFFGKKFLDLKNNTMMKIYKIGISIPFSIFAGLRNENVGYDTHNYILNYINFDRISSNILIDGYPFNYLYYIIIKGTFILTDINVNAFLFIMAFITMYVIASAYEIDKNNYSVWGILLFMFYLAPRMLDQARQFMALGFFALALLESYKLHQARCVLFMIIGGLIHETVLIFIPVYFAAKILRGKIKYTFIISVMILLGCFFDTLFSIILQYLPEHYLYIELQQKINGSVDGWFWVLDILPLIVSLIYFYKMGKGSGNVDFIELVAWSAIPFRLLAYYSFFVMRMYYYGAMAGILLACISWAHDTKNTDAFKISVICIYMLFWMFEVFLFNMNGVIPYEWCIYD